MDKPKVFVIVLNYRVWPDTLECLSSLQEIDYPNFKVIVVDNGSRDDSARKIGDWIGDKKDRFLLIETAVNLGYAAGNNVGLRYALKDNPSYIWILNNDTKVASDSLDRLVSFCEINPLVGFAGCSIYFFDDPQKIQALGGGSIHPFLGISRHITDNNTPLSYIHGASIFARRKAVDEIGLLDEKFFLYWEDADWSLRAIKAGWKLAIAVEAKIWHKEGAVATPRSALSDYHHARSAVIFFRKHYGLRAILPVTLMMGGKLFARILRGEFARTLLVLRGCYNGLMIEKKRSVSFAKNRLDAHG